MNNLDDPDRPRDPEAPRQWWTPEDAQRTAAFVEAMVADPGVVAAIEAAVRERGDFYIAAYAEPRNPTDTPPA